MFNGEPYVYSNDGWMRRLVNVSWTLAEDTAMDLGTNVEQLVADSSGFYVASLHLGAGFSPNGTNFAYSAFGLPADTIFQGVDTLYSWPVSSIAINDSTIFAGTHRGLYHSSKTSLVFSHLSNAIPDSIVHAVFAQDSLLVAAIGNDLYRSLDDGLSWAICNTPLHGECAQIQQLNDTLFASYPVGGLMYSADGGLTWTAINSGLRHLSAYCVAYRNGEYYVGSSDGIYSGLGAWTKMEYGYSCLNILSMAERDSCIVAASSEGIYQTINGGATWDRETDGMEMEPNANMVLLDGNFLQASQTNQSGGALDLLVSSDCGNGWTESTVAANPGYLMALSSNGNQAIASGSNGHWRITNGGANIIPMGSMQNMWCSSEPELMQVDNAIYAMSCPSVPLYRSTDNGANWVNVSAGLPLEYAYVVARVGNLLFTTFYNSFYQSYSNGTYWFRSDDGIPSNAKPIMAFEYDGTYYYCTDGCKVWASVDGYHWSDVSQGLPNTNTTRDFAPLVIQGGNIYFGTFRDGVWKRSLSEISVSAAPPITLAALHLYPNPATDRIYWTSPEKVLQVQCFNTLGQAVDAPMVSSYLDVSRLPHGVYIVRATLRNGSLVSGRVIVGR
jgi:hypothetical protein